MPRPPFLEALAARVLVCDGAMGTMLYGKGIFINRCFESLNVSAPDLVRDVHREYLAAGADVIETNTFGASRLKLRAFGLGNEVHALNLAGARLARAAAGDDAYVAGAIGPAANEASCAAVGGVRRAACGNEKHGRPGR